MKSFSGSRVLFGCAFFIFVITSGNGLYSAGYSLLAKTFNTTMGHLGTYSMILSIGGMISSVLLTTVKNKITLKGVLYYNAVIFYIVALSAILLGESLATLLLFFFSVGTTLAMGAQVVMTEIISNWYVEGRAKKISIILGSALLGQATYQFIGGQIYTRMDLLSGWFLLYMVNGTLLMLIAKFLIVATRPEDIMQVALGSEAAPVPETVQKKSPNSTDSLPIAPRRSIYANPVFWLCLLADWGLSGGVNYVTVYATTFFTHGGLSLSTSTIILSCATLSAALLSFLNGHILNALKVRKYVAFLLIGVILGNLNMIIYGKYPSFIFVILIVLFYGIGYSGPHCINLVSGLLFDPEDAANANSKISGIAMSGGLLMLPGCAYLVEKFGFTAMYLGIIAITVISLFAFQTAFFLAIKQGKKI